MSTDQEEQDQDGAPAEAGPLTPVDPVDEITPRLPKRRVGLVATIAGVALVLDQLSKALAAADLVPGEPVTVVRGVLYFDLVRNSGAAFSMATGVTWVLALIAVAVVVAIVWIARRLRSVGWGIGLGLVLAGALGNLTDRVFRAPSPLQGHVVDFISAFSPDGRGWAVFNLADSAICVGGALIVLLSLLGKDYDGTSTKDKPAGRRG